MNVSYILVWSDTNTMNRNDSKSYSVNEEVNQELLRHTLSLIDQILKTKYYSPKRKNMEINL